jgi:hypothetical protein
MPMTYDEVQPDSRVICHSRGGITGTVIRKFRGGEDGSTEYVQVDYDECGPAFNYPSQLDRLAAPDTPAEPAAEVTADQVEALLNTPMGAAVRDYFWQQLEDEVARLHATGKRSSAHTAGGVMLAQQIVHPDRSAGWQD